MPTVATALAPPLTRQNYRARIRAACQLLYKGELKVLAEKERIDYSRAKDISRGRVAPREHELNFIHRVLDTVLPRIEVNRRLQTLE